MVDSCALLRVGARRLGMFSLRSSGRNVPLVRCDLLFMRWTNFEAASSAVAADSVLVVDLNSLVVDGAEIAAAQVDHRGVVKEIPVVPASAAISVAVAAEAAIDST